MGDVTEAMTDLHAEILALLTERQWSATVEDSLDKWGTDGCPQCFNARVVGHAPDCRWAKVMVALGGSPQVRDS